MLVKQRTKVILKQIDLCRNELNSLVSTSHGTSENVLKVSQELDKLILNYYHESQYYEALSK